MKDLSEAALEEALLELKAAVVERGARLDYTPEYLSLRLDLIGDLAEQEGVTLEQMLKALHDLEAEVRQGGTYP